MSKIAIISDSHDNFKATRKIIDICNSRKLKTIIHCGDLISYFMLKELTLFKGKVHLIYGNNAGDQHLISSRCGTMFKNIKHHGLMGEINISGKNICFVHYPKSARALAEQLQYDIVCYGHNHIYKVEEISELRGGIVKSTLLINPGEVMGKDDLSGFVILDTETLETEHIQFEE